MGDLHLPEPLAGTNWTGVSRADLDDLEQLVRAIEYVDDPIQTLTRHDLERFCDQCRPGESALLRDRGGSAVAYAVLVPSHEADGWRISAHGGVQPSWRYQGVGRGIVAWQVAQARRFAAERAAGEPVELVTFVDAKSANACSLIEQHGFTATRWFFDMHHQFLPAGTAPPPPYVEGIAILPYTPDLSEAVRAAHNAAFGSLGYPDVSQADWEAQLARPSSRPQWSWVGLVHGQVVGYAMNALYADDHGTGYSEGWTERLGVIPEYRSRGLARALLSWSMKTFGENGLDGAGVGIDTTMPGDMQRLLGGLGYETQEMLVQWSLRVA